MVADAVKFVVEARRVLETTVPPTGVRTRPVGAVGAAVSITMALLPARDEAPPVVGSDTTASLPDASRIVPRLSARAFTVA